MVQFFGMVGDVEPNVSEIHLGMPHKYTRYGCTSSALGNVSCILRPYAGKRYSQGIRGGLKYWGEEIQLIGYAAFCQVWRTCLPYVKIRAYKSYGGKCATCAMFSDLRSRFRDPLRRQIVTALFAIHRLMYMGERAAYMERIQDAMRSPDEFLSVIADGMQQSHCDIPYMRNLNSSFPKLHQR